MSETALVDARLPCRLFPHGSPILLLRPMRRLGLSWMQSVSVYFWSSLGRILVRDCKDISSTVCLVLDCVDWLAMSKLDKLCRPQVDVVGSHCGPSRLRHRGAV